MRIQVILLLNIWIHHIHKRNWKIFFPSFYVCACFSKKVYIYMGVNACVGLSLILMWRNHLNFVQAGSLSQLKAHHLASQFPLKTHLHLELQAGSSWVLKGWAIFWTSKTIPVPAWSSLYVLQLSNSICRATMTKNRMHVCF